MKRELFHFLWQGALLCVRDQGWCAVKDCSVFNVNNIVCIN